MQLLHQAIGPSKHVEYSDVIRYYVLQVFSTYRFTFDHVYAHDSAQADVYMNSARESVLNALQVRFGCMQLLQRTMFKL